MAAKVTGGLGPSAGSTNCEMQDGGEMLTGIFVTGRKERREGKEAGKREESNL